MVIITKCFDLILSVNTPVLPSTDAELLRFRLMVATVMVYFLPGVSTLKVHSLMFGSTSLVSTVMLPVQCRRRLSER